MMKVAAGLNAMNFIHSHGFSRLGLEHFPATEFILAVMPP